MLCTGAGAHAATMNTDFSRLLAFLITDILGRAPNVTQFFTHNYNVLTHFIRARDEIFPSLWWFEC